MLSRFACWTLPCARDAVVTPLEGARRDVHKRMEEASAVPFASLRGPRAIYIRSYCTIQ